MKSLSRVTQNIKPSVTKEITTSTQSLGLIKAAGKQTGLVKSAIPLIDHSGGVDSAKAQADLMMSLMLEKKPKKCYASRCKAVGLMDNGDIRYVRSYSWVTPECTAEEEDIIEQNLLPCPKETIIDLITRYLEVHKKHIIEGQSKRLILYADMANLLYGIPEYALTLGIIDVLKDKNIVFFPVVGQVSDAAEKYLKDWPEDTSSGEEPLR